MAQSGITRGIDRLREESNEDLANPPPATGHLFALDVIIIEKPVKRIVAGSGDVLVFFCRGTTILAVCLSGAPARTPVPKIQN